MTMPLNCLIRRWRSQRNRRLLQSLYSARYAFVGVGSHALQNLYPVLQYLGIQLKYICCKSADKVPLIETRFGVAATISLDTILDDDEVKGVFVCTSPRAHYEICSRVIASGKYLFVEKPPCLTPGQLENLIAADRRHVTMVGMQKRYSPLARKLRERVADVSTASYAMAYHTGAYPEGEPFFDLFIHPVDLALYLFGNAEINAVQRADSDGTTTVQALLSHGRVKGFIELSTAHSWANTEDSVRVNTPAGEYRLEQMERLCYYPHPKKIAGMPIEKLGLFTPSEQLLAGRDNFSPLVSNNQLYTQGFISEISVFADMVEHSGRNHSPLSSMRNVYNLLTALKYPLQPAPDTPDIPIVPVQRESEYNKHPFSKFRL